MIKSHTGCYAWGGFFEFGP